MSIISNRTIPIREKRERSISAFGGTASALSAEATDGLVPRVRTFAQDTRSDLQSALQLLSTIRDLATVVHGPVGCLAGLRAGDRSLVSGINQRDSILGGDKKLKATILRAAVELKPSAIAVVSSPVAAINNDDAEAVISELREQLELPILYVRADAFKSRQAANGVDLVAHAILRESAGQRSTQNGQSAVLLSVRESLRDIESLNSLLAQIGVTVRTFPQFSSATEWRETVGSRVAIAIDPTDADFIGHALQEDLGTQYLGELLPIGVQATSRWLALVARALDATERAAAVIAEHGSLLEPFKQQAAALEGSRRVYVSGPPRVAVALAELAQELGLTLSGITLAHADHNHESRIAELAAAQPKLPVLVGEGQAFEEANQLRKVGADLYIGIDSPVHHVLRLGIPVLDLAAVPIYGFEGARRIADAILRRLSNPALARFLGQGTELYSDKWFMKSVHWHIKHEVK